MITCGQVGCDLPVDKWLVIYIWTNGLWFAFGEVGCDLPVNKWAVIYLWTSGL